MEVNYPIFQSIQPACYSQMNDPVTQQSESDQAVNLFLQLCLRGRWDAASLQTAQALSQQDGFDWEDVVQTAQRERVAPLLYSIVRGWDAVPPRPGQSLLDAYNITARRNLYRLHELATILHRLEEQGVASIVLKGAALAEVIYSNIAVRPMDDLDVLVHRKDVSAALSVLDKLGYAPLNAQPHAGNVLAYGGETALRKPGPLDVMVEIHWSLFNSPYYQHKVSSSWFWETARQAKIGDVFVQILGPEAQLLHLCAHLWLHHGGEGLFWWFDIATVITFYHDQIDWDQVLTRAQTHELILPAQQALGKIAREWAVPIPPNVLERLRALHPSKNELRGFAWLGAEHWPVAYEFWAELSGKRTWQQRLSLAWENLVPPPAYMQQRYHVHPPALLPLYYPYRWLRGIKSAFKSLLCALPILSNR